MPDPTTPAAPAAATHALTISHAAEILALITSLAFKAIPAIAGLLAGQPETIHASGHIAGHNVVADLTLRIKP